MRQINLDHLLTLKIIVETGGFTAAARQLNLSQSAVSVQMRELEARMGVKLLDRIGKTAAPTSAGRAMLRHAEVLLAAADDAQAAMSRYRDGALGEVRIGASTTAMIYRLPQVLAPLRRKHPDLEIHLTAGTTTTIVERLQSNTIDLGVVSLPLEVRGVEVTPLFDEPMLAIFQRDARDLPDLVRPDDMRSHALLLESGRAHVKLAVMDWLARAGPPPRPAMELDNLEVITRMVAAGIGASLVPASVVEGREERGELQVRPLDPPLLRSLAMVARTDRTDTPALSLVKKAIIAMKPGTARPPARSRTARAAR